MCTHTCIWPNKYHTTHNIEKLHVTNKNENVWYYNIVFAYGNEYKININVTSTTGYYCGHNNQQIQIKNKIKLEKK